VLCESWKAELDTYLDGELPSEEMRAFDAHVHSCSSCAADALARVQLKRGIQAAAGKRFAPTSEFRRRIQGKIATKPQRSFRLTWVFAAALSTLAVASLLTTFLGVQRFHREQAYGEIADLHVAALASSSRVDVVSTDRHTVKPWFQGKIPFAFDLPEVQNSEFTLLGGRMTYAGQSPGAHLIYTVRKHEISVFVFQEGVFRRGWGESSSATKELSFNIATWNQGGLRYFVIGDASTADINNLAKLFKTTSS
jgi:anti-sigma factor RsiW